MTKFVAQHGGTNPREVVKTKEKMVRNSLQLSLKNEEKKIIILHQIQTVSRIHKNKMKLWLLLASLSIGSPLRPRGTWYQEGGLVYSRR
jgi:hypothetical protein